MMSNRSTRLATLLSVTLALVLLLQPATAVGQGRTQKISKKLIERAEDMVDELDESKDQLNKTMRKYDSIFSKNKVKDRQKAFSDLNKEIKNTEDRVKKVRERSQDMQREADKFFTEWSQGLASIGDDELRALSRTTMEENRARYGEVIESGLRASTLYDSFLADLKNQTAYLALDVSDAAMERLQETQAATKDKASELITLVDQLSRATKDYLDSMK